ncbi:hypothetical protein ACFWQG_13225 [Rhodococcus sp. NPDC058532]|uniref:hypothetical protein n=1 Tax=Rhodococcus sp. NPDC058532 TaxID=3346540 RepID=UPI00365AC752
MSHLLCIESAANHAKVPPFALAVACGLGHLPHLHTPDGVHIESDDLDDWMTANQIDDLTADFGDEAPGIGALLLAAAVVLAGIAAALVGYWLGS